MFDFIVSGQIPGTDIFITFQTVLATASLLIGVILARHVAKTQSRDNVPGVEEITL